MKQIIIMSSNAKKIEWFKYELRKYFKIPILSIKEYSKGFVEIEETGDTCKTNALIKAQSLLASDSLVIGEDGGLFVSTLDGFPGIKTNRWITGTEDFKGEELLSLLKGQKNRHAKFISSLAAVLPDGEVIFGEGVLEGTITREVKGKNGLGYSRIFIPEGESKTIAELGYFAEKSNQHRISALSLLLEQKPSLFEMVY